MLPSKRIKEGLSRDHFFATVLCGHVGDECRRVDGTRRRANQNRRQKFGDVLVQQSANRSMTVSTSFISWTCIANREECTNPGHEFT